jgi:hypothetical protein
MARAAVAAATLTGASAVLAPAAAAPGTGPAATTTLPAPAPAAVLLLNGDHALVSSAGGGPVDAILRAPGQSGLAGSTVTLRAGANTLIMPAAAMPFLGRGLNPSLFEVGALSHAEHGGRLRVTVRYQGKLHALPGVTLTRRGPGTAQGYLTASSAVTFGSALARQMLADHARASYGRDGMFSGGETLSLPGAPAPRPAPDFPMHTLTVRGTNLAGQPDTGDEVTVWNVTDFGKFGDLTENFSAFYHGTARFSVPAGIYWAFGGFSTTAGGLRLDILPQFAVRGDTTVAASARAANSRLAFVTPRPAVDAGATNFSLVRGGRRGAVTWSFGGPRSMWVNPVSQRPSAGFLYSATSTQLVSPAGPGTPYTYALDFPAPPGTVSSQHFVVRPGDLATVHERFYQDPPKAGGWLTLGGTPAQFRTLGFGGTSTPLRMPGTQTLYLTARPAALWQTSTFIAGVSAGQTNAWRLYHGGEHLAEAWNAYPLHPGPNVSLPGSISPALPSASRAGNRLILDITPFTDNAFGHTGAGFNDNGGSPSGSAGRYALYQNGKLIASGTARQSFSGDLLVVVPVSARRAAIRFVMTASRKGAAPNPSSSSQDAWTFQTRPDPTATVPAPWFCGATLVRHHVRFDRHCAVQDLMTLSYQLAGLSLAGTTRPGTQSLGITVAHLEEAAAPRVRAAVALVSYNGGKTWKAADLTRTGPGQFRASFTAPARTGVSLRVVARDSQGATITETILGAYQTSG